MIWCWTQCFSPSLLSVCIFVVFLFRPDFRGQRVRKRWRNSTRWTRIRIAGCFSTDFCPSWRTGGRRSSSVRPSPRIRSTSSSSTSSPKTGEAISRLVFRMLSIPKQSCRNDVVTRTLCTMITYFPLNLFWCCKNYVLKIWFSYERKKL